MIDTPKQVSFFKAIELVFRQRHDWHGASSRAEFWKFQLFLLLLSNFFILPLDAVIFSYKIHSPVSSLWLLFITYINACLTLRRLYDSGTPYSRGLLGIGIVVGFLLFAHAEGWQWWLSTGLFILSCLAYIYYMTRPSWDRDLPRGEEKIVELPPQKTDWWG